jgi:hypothetical protein
VAAHDELRRRADHRAEGVVGLDDPPVVADHHAVHRRRREPPEAGLALAQRRLRPGALAALLPELHVAAAEGELRGRLAGERGERAPLRGVEPPRRPVEDANRAEVKPSGSTSGAPA